VRRVLVEGIARPTVAAAFGICTKTVGKWVARFEAEGAAGLFRSSRPHRLTTQRRRT
jgi:transposase